MRQTLRAFSAAACLALLLPALGRAAGVTISAPSNPANVPTTFTVTGRCNICGTNPPFSVDITVGTGGGSDATVGTLAVSTAADSTFGTFSGTITAPAGSGQKLQVWHVANNTGLAYSNQVTVNVAAPAAVIIHDPDNNQFFKPLAALAINVSDTASATVSYSLDGSAFYPVTETPATSGSYKATTAAPGTDGSYDLDVSDNLGTSGSVVIKVDGTGPSVGSAFPVNGTITTSTIPTLSVVVSDPVVNGVAAGLGSVTFKLDAAAAAAPSGVAGSTYSFNTAGLLNGLHAVTVTATDAIGNTTQVAWVFRVDNTLPTVTALSPQNLTVTSNASPTLAFTVSDPTANGYASGLVLPPTLLLDGGAVVPSTASGSDPYAYTYAASGLAEGVHAVTVTARDLAGNTRNTAWVFTVDNTPPTASNGLPSGVTKNARPRISAQLADPGGSGVAPASVSLTVDAVAVSAVYSTFTGQVSFTPPSNLTNGPHAVTVDLLDRAGNAATQLAWSFNIDTTVPTISNALPADLSSPGSNPTLSFQLDDPLNNAYASGLDLPPSMIFDGVALSAGSLSSDGLPSPTYSYTPPSLGNGTHSVTVTAQDLAGNSTKLSWVFFVDNLAPVIDTLRPAPGSLTRTALPVISARIVDEVNGSGVAPASVSVTVDGVAVPASFNPGTGAISYTPSSPLAEGGHSVTVDGTDRAGNPAPQQAWSFLVDSQGPVLNFILPDATSPPNSWVLYNISYYNGYPIYGQAYDSPSGVSRVAFYQNNNLIETAYYNAGSWSSASAVAAGYPSFSYPLIFWDTKTVADGSNYRLLMVGYDTLGNQAQSQTVTVQVNNSIPSVSLLTPTAQAYRRPGDSVDVVFISSDPNPASARITLQDGSGTVYGQTVMVSLTAQTTAGQAVTASVQVMAGTPDGTLLSVAVRLTNQAGQSGFSPLTLTNSVLVDGSLPSASAPLPLGLTNSATPLIQASLADAVSGVDYQSVSMTVDGAWVNASAAAGLASYTPAGLAPGVHQVTVDLKDLAGNAANQLAWTFTVDAEGPQVSLAPLSGLQAGFGTGFLTFTASVTDAPAGVSRVALYRNGTLVDTAYPSAGLWSSASVAGQAQPQFRWDSSSVADSAGYAFYAVAFDTLDNQGQSVSQTVGVLNNAPTAALLAPASTVYRRPGGTVDAAFSFGGVALDSATLTLVDAGGNTLAQQLVSPLGSALSPLTVTVQVPAGAADGLLSLRLRVQNLLGRSASAVGADVILVDTVPPLASQPAPLLLTGTAAPLITAQIADAASGVAPQSVSMTVDGAWVPAANNGVTVSFTAAALATGPHVVTVDLRDRSGNQGPQLTWAFNVDLQNPLAVLTQPLPGSVLKGTVALVAAVSDAPANVSRVAFYDGATLINTSYFNGSTWKDSGGAASTGPGATWNTSAAADGAHSLTALAWDQAGNSQSSLPVAVTVDNGLPLLTLGVLPAAQLVGTALQVYVPQVTLKGTVTDAVSGISGMTLVHANASGQPVNSSNPQIAPPSTGSSFSWQLDLIQGYNAITVTATDRAGNLSTATLGLVYVPSSAAATLCQEGGTLSSANGSSLVLPSGALSGCVDLGLQVRPAASLPKPQDPALSLVGNGTAVGPDGLVFLKLGILTLAYTNADLDQDQDGTPDLAAAGLRVAYFDGSRWLRLGVDSVDTVNRRVSLRVNHSGLFALYREGAALASDVKVFLTANPFRYGPGGHTDFVFDLPQGGTVTLQIFDLKGQRVRTIVEQAPYGPGRLSLAWDGKSGTGDFAGSGVYLYRFEAKLADGSSVVKTKTLGVIQ